MRHDDAWIPNQIAIIGCGTIGIGWAAYFLSKGLKVVAFEPDSQVREIFTEEVGRAMQAMGVPSAVPEVSDNQARAVAEAELIVENAPERAELKRELIRSLQGQAPANAIIASSTSSLMHSDIALAAADSGRVVIAHPFNPPHLIPLVELFGTDAEVVERMRSFYTAIGKHPVVLKKEMPGHIANRLSAALWREALYLVQEGVASVADIDAAVTAGPGLRWAIQGPFLTYHLGGGAGGIRHYMEHLGPSQQYRWASLGEPTMDAALTAEVIAGVDAEAAGRSLQQLAEHRDELLIALQERLKQT